MTASVVLLIPVTPHTPSTPLRHPSDTPTLAPRQVAEPSTPRAARLCADRWCLRCVSRGADDAAAVRISRCSRGNSALVQLLPPARAAAARVSASTTSTATFTAAPAAPLPFSEAPPLPAGLVLNLLAVLVLFVLAARTKRGPKLAAAALRSGATLLEHLGRLAGGLLAAPGAWRARRAAAAQRALAARDAWQLPAATANWQLPTAAAYLHDTSPEGKLSSAGTLERPRPFEQANSSPVAIGGEGCDRMRWRLRPYVMGCNHM